MVKKFLQTPVTIKIQVIVFFVLMVAALWCLDQESKDSNSLFGTIREEVSENVQRTLTGTYIDSDGNEWTEWKEVTAE